jgi:hypothetical protein
VGDGKRQLRTCAEAQRFDPVAGGGRRLRHWLPGRSMTTRPDSKTAWIRPTVEGVLKNEYTKRLLRVTGRRPPQQLPRSGTPHYRMSRLEANRGWLDLQRYRGPTIRPSEWETLAYTTYATDPNTFFAPITSATGELELSSFSSHGKCDLDGEWTPNAQRCPTIVRWIEPVRARFGRVQLLRMTPNTLSECRWGLHLDNNNHGNPETNGWAVRAWLELTDDDSSRLVLRQEEFD